ncbi:MAG: murD, partial [Gammaproteobacteria bacterium]|nr:murD [Gammaproteobacteria bacterium]
MKKKNLNIIIGLGITGLSCAHYLAKKNIPFIMMDTRETPPQLAEFKKLFPDAPIVLGKLDDAVLDQADKIIISPGISLKTPPIARQVARGVSVMGDIELFALSVTAPVIAITGTNAKSTVTTLVGEMAAAAGIKVQVGGNLGIPVLDLLSALDTELFVLELSSFQLETVYSLAPQVATVLNVTHDHMDRYETLEDYCKAKQHIYSNCAIAVCNRDDPLTDCGHSSKKITFTLNPPEKNEFGLLKQNNEMYLAFENQLLMPVKELPILGRHYQANALAALAIGYGYGLPMEPMLHVLRTFTGLPHRCQFVRDRNGVRWYNDSKGTNVGATLAAIEGLGKEIEGKIILIAGGVGKNADFMPLVEPITRYVKTAVLIGEDASILGNVIGEQVETYFAKSMEEAVIESAKIAKKGDIVL